MRNVSKFITSFALIIAINFTAFGAAAVNVPVNDEAAAKPRIDDTGAAAADAGFYEPYKAWIFGDSLYITDASYSTVSRVSLSSGASEQLAGEADTFGSVDGIGTAARFGHPAGIWADNRDIFVTDSYFDTVRRISLKTGVVTTVAGLADGDAGFTDGFGSAARFNTPNGIWSDGTNLYVCDTLNFTIRKIVIATGEVTTFAGTPQSRGSNDGIGAAAQFYAPMDIYGDGSTLYVADGSAIRQINLKTRMVQTLAGLSATASYSDGPAASARFNFIGGIWGGGSSLYIADTGNNTVRKLSLNTNVVTTIAGDDGSFSSPSDIAGHGSKIYILDSLNFMARQSVPPADLHVPFQFKVGSGMAMKTAGEKSTLQKGFARIQAAPGGSAPSGLILFGYTANGVLVSETIVAPGPALQSGRFFADMMGSARTGISVANGNDKAVQFNFYVTDAGGADLYSGSTWIEENSQIAAFLNEAPFAPAANANVDLTLARTVTFTASAPVAVAPLRGTTNERSEFLMSAVPVADLRSVQSQPISFPYFADGAGWSSKVVLVNPTDAPVSGMVEFFGQAAADGQAPQTMVTIEGQSGSSFPYAIPAHSAVEMRTAGGGSAMRAGWVRATPAQSSASPAGMLLLSLQSNGVLVSETSIAGIKESPASLVYAEMSGDFHSAAKGSVQSALAVSNPSNAATAVTVELLGLDGAETGFSGTLTVPALGQVTMFLDQISGFQTLDRPFKGLFRVTGSDVAVTGLRARYTERGDLLLTAAPSIAESKVGSSTEFIFPYLIDGAGFTSELILFGGSIGEGPSGTLNFVDQAGLSLGLELNR